MHFGLKKMARGKCVVMMGTYEGGDVDGRFEVESQRYILVPESYVVHQLNTREHHYQ